MYNCKSSIKQTPKNVNIVEPATQLDSLQHMAGCAEDVGS